MNQSNSQQSTAGDKNARGQRGGTLGTFGGVFTPSILTILGVIMYLRFGWVVGNVGLLGSLLIVTLSTGITFLTALSIAAIATDQHVKIGGAYYMISRSLGIETGGAVGIPLFLAQGLSVALYTLGFAESLVGVFPMLNETAVGVIVTILVAVLALTSARIAIRAQYIIMTAIALSLISLVFGKPIEPSDIEMWGARGRVSEPFWTVFAVFFPAVTGIMAGVNMSGDLKDPGKSLPRGTFYAIGAGYLVYMLLPIILAGRADAVTLIEDSLIMRKMAFWGDAILLGVWGATLSSAVGSILGAPRVLQALARDRVLPRYLRWLGKGSGEDDTPRAGTLLTLGLALLAVYFGNLNFIAPLLTMFFLTTYGVLNIAAGLERFLGSPSFRPKFKVHWFWSLLGAVGCIAVMFLVNAVATIAAIIIVFLIFIWLERRNLKSSWGDVRRGIWMSTAQFSLQRISSTADAKNWRPHLLVMSGAPTSRWHLIDLATSITHNKGLMTVSTVLQTPNISTKRQQELETKIRDYLHQQGVHGLARVITADNPFQGVEQMVDVYGLGPLVPNTVMVGDTKNPDHYERFAQMITHIYASNRNLLVVHDQEEVGFGDHQRIDIWWSGMKQNGALMMVLAYLLRTSINWRNADIHMKMIVESDKAAESASQNLKYITSNMRTGAMRDVIVNRDRSFREIIRESSQGADLVFLGMAHPPKVDDYVKYYRNLRSWTEELPSTVFVLAAEEVSFGKVLQ